MCCFSASGVPADRLNLLHSQVSALELSEPDVSMPIQILHLKPNLEEDFGRIGEFLTR